MLAPPLRRGVALPLLYVKQYKPDPWACQDYFLFSCQDRTPNQKYISPRAPGGILLSPPPTDQNVLSLPLYDRPG
ncbi:hypothetical protein [Escherichia phage vB_EcoM_EP57]|nr:hypothetical protein [Escherichia phage vB_EcoM_EP57]